MGKFNINRVIRTPSRQKQVIPDDQLTPASRAARRRTGKRIYPGPLVHVVQVWTAVPHPRYGDRVPHFVPSHLQCVSDHRNTRECYVRRNVRRRQS